MSLTRIPSSGLAANITLGNVVISGSLTHSNGAPFLGSGGTGEGTGFTGSRGAAGFAGSQGIEGESSFVFSNTPPPNPAVGDRWYDTTLGFEFVWVDDGDTAQWVEITTAGNGERGFTGSQGYGSVNFLTRNYTGDSTTTVYTVSAGLGVDNVFVFENGVMQFPTTDYTITGTNLTFTTAPASGVAIQIRELNNAGSIDPTSLAGLTDVDVSSAVAGQVLGYTGSNWVPTAGGGGGTTASQVYGLGTVFSFGG